MGSDTHAVAWRVASACQGGGCIEVAPKADSVAIRATGDRNKTIIVTAAEWHAFAEGMKKGEFDNIGSVASTSAWSAWLPDIVVDLAEKIKPHISSMYRRQIGGET